MLSVKKSQLIPGDKKNLKFTLYLFSLFIFFSISYFSTPKLLTFSTDSIKESLKNNNNIHINSILDVKYKIFPTPRLSIVNSDFVIGEGIAKVKNSEISFQAYCFRVSSQKLNTYGVKSAKPRNCYRFF